MNFHQMALLLEEAKAFLPKETYICFSIQEAHRVGGNFQKSVVDDLDQIITHRLGDDSTLRGWLMGVGVPVSSLTVGRVQTHRRQWMDRMINEFQYRHRMINTLREMRISLTRTVKHCPKHILLEAALRNPMDKESIREMEDFLGDRLGEGCCMAQWLSAQGAPPADVTPKRLRNHISQWLGMLMGEFYTALYEMAPPSTPWEYQNVKT